MQKTTQILNLPGGQYIKVQTSSPMLHVQVLHPSDDMNDVPCVYVTPLTTQSVFSINNLHDSKLIHDNKYQYIDILD